jgi:hypothetical protein
MAVVLLALGLFAIAKLHVNSACLVVLPGICCRLGKNFDFRVGGA